MRAGLPGLARILARRCRGDDPIKQDPILSARSITVLVRAWRQVSAYGQALIESAPAYRQFITTRGSYARCSVTNGFRF